MIGCYNLVGHYDVKFYLSSVLDGRCRRVLRAYPNNPLFVRVLPVIRIGS